MRIPDSLEETENFSKLAKTICEAGQDTLMIDHILCPIPITFANAVYDEKTGKLLE